MKFDAYAALAHLRQDPDGCAIRAIRAIPAAANCTNSTNSTGLAVEAETGLRPGGTPEIVQTAGHPHDPLPNSPAIVLPRPTDAESMASPPVPSFATQYEEPSINADGYYRTWQGRVVRPNEWQQLEEWDRHGPAGRLFCGICSAWVGRNDDCRVSGCWKAAGGVA